MNFKLEKNGRTGHDRFVHYNFYGQVDAEVNFKINDSQKTYTIFSTVVAPSLQGLGIARDLMVTMAEHARTTDYHIINSCPYAEDFFNAHQAVYSDVLK